MPRHENSTSFKKGQKAALGNDKTAKLSTFIEIALRNAKTVGELDEARSQAHAIAEDFVNSYWDAKTITDKKAVFTELMDRTEGKASQPILHGEDEDHPIRSLFLKPDKMTDQE